LQLVQIWPNNQTQPDLTSLPAVYVTGAHHSACVLRPSKHILEANNTEPHAESSKCAHSACKKVVESDLEDEASTPHVSNAGTDTDVEMEDSITAENAYALTKVMGDQDHKVSVLNFIYTTRNLLLGVIELYFYLGFMYSVKV
jgi:hypothetical protein